MDNTFNQSTVEQHVEQVEPQVLVDQPIQEDPAAKLMIGINKELAKKKIKTPKFIYMMAEAEKGEKKGLYEPIVNLYNYVFGEEKTKELFEYFETYEELNGFLVKIAN